MLIVLWLIDACDRVCCVFAYVNAAGWLWILGVGVALITALALHAMPRCSSLPRSAVIALLLAIPLN